MQNNLPGDRPPGLRRSLAQAFQARTRDAVLHNAPGQLGTVKYADAVLYAANMADEVSR
jgi:hypothetical protein